MAEALIKGLISTGEIKPQDIYASDIFKDRLEHLERTYDINGASSNIELVQDSDVIFICVKPQSADALLAEVGPHAKQKLFISIMAGITTENIEDYLQEAKVIRVMPNTPAMVGKGISAVSKGSKAGTDDLQTASLLLKNAGEVIIIDESLMDAVTAISGSGPAYFYWLTEILIEAGIKMGIEREKAEKLAKQTLIGSAGLLEKEGAGPEELRERVTSPGGTTEAALDLLAEKDTEKIILEAIKAAKKRSGELSK